MRRKIPLRIRQEVARRAGYRCEYCLIHEEDTFYGCQVEHIISIKHGGTDDLDNLAYACAFCNYSKGANIATVLGEPDRMVRLYNPRRDSWQEHFRLEGAYIVPISEIGEATVKVLGLNHPARVMEREMLIRAGKYPPTDER
jgi:5-methylcytosine-specific restriction endonuclease McrA